MVLALPLGHVWPDYYTMIQPAKEEFRRSMQVPDNAALLSKLPVSDLELTSILGRRKEVVFRTTKFIHKSNFHLLCKMDVRHLITILSFRLIN